MREEEQPTRRLKAVPPRPAQLEPAANPRLSPLEVLGLILGVIIVIIAIGLLVKVAIWAWAL